MKNSLSLVDPDRARLQQRGRAGRRLLIALVLAWIFEGALRKWGFPGAQRYLYFIREPVIVLIYIYALSRRRPTSRAISVLVVAIAIGATLFVAYHLFRGQPLFQA